MTGLSAGAICAAITAVVFVFLRRWRRHGRNDLAILLVGAAMIMAGLVVGFWLLPVHEAPREEPAALGVLPPERTKVGRGRGFVVGMAVFVENCGDPVRVVVVTNGSAEYWRGRSPRFPRRATFRLTLPGTAFEDIEIGQSSDATDISVPIYAEPETADFLVPRAPQERHGVTVLSGKVAGWEARLNAVVASFEAEWLSPRGLGSCYLNLPSLTGTLTVLASKQGKGQAALDVSRVAPPEVPIIRSERTGLAARYDPAMETTYGTTTVVVEGGDVVSESSLPAPDRSSDGNATWVCETDPARVRSSDATGPLRAPRDVLTHPSTSGAAYSRAYLRNAQGTDCSSVATVIENRAGTLRDLVLLLLGAALSLGAAIVVEGLLDRLRQKRVEPPT